MPNSSVRTVVLFGIIAVILLGAAVGGVRLIKSRNSAYATSSQQKVAQTDTKQQPVQQNKKDTSTSSSSNPTQPQTKTAVPPASTNTTPAPAADTPKSTTTPPSVPVQNNDLPATSGFSLGQALPTLVLMALAGLFGSKLVRARADYRRYIGS